MGGSGCGLEVISQGQRVRGWWGDVVKSLSDSEGDWFASSLFRKVGNGSHTRFWEDIWVGDVKLRAAFPRLYDISLTKGCTVAEAGEWVENRWIWGQGWRRELRGWEADSLCNLIALLECRKQVPDDADSWVWKLETNNCFTVKSAYNLLLERKVEVNKELKNSCKLLWKNFAVPKAQATAWRVFFRRIATRAELKRRGVIEPQVDASCPLCNSREESVEHLFVECRRVSNLWSSCLQWIGIQAPIFNKIPGNFFHFCYLGQCKIQRSLLASLWICTIWTIWKKRNDIVFNNGEWNHDKILGEIKSFLWNWMVGKGVLLKSNISFNCWCANSGLFAVL